MTQTETKRTKQNSILTNIKAYTKIYRLLCDNRTGYIQRLRKIFRGNKSEMVFGKYKPLEKVLGTVFSPEDMNRLRGTNSYKKSDRIYCYLLTDLEEKQILNMINSVAYVDYEKKGNVFSADIVLPAGELLNEESVRISNTLFKELHALGLTEAVMNPKTNNIELAKETCMGKKGEEITKEKERLMKHLGMKNKQFNAEVVGKLDVSKE